MYLMNQLFLLLLVMVLTRYLKAASRVIDAAVEKAYNGEKRIEWKEVLAGQKLLMKQVNGYLKNA